MAEHTPGDSLTILDSMLQVATEEAGTFQGGAEWLSERGVEVIDLGSDECTQMLDRFIEEHPALRHKDIGID